MASFSRWSWTSILTYIPKSRPCRPSYIKQLRSPFQVCGVCGISPREIELELELGPLKYFFLGACPNWMAGRLPGKVDATDIRLIHELISSPMASLDSCPFPPGLLHLLFYYRILLIFSLLPPIPCQWRSTCIVWFRLSLNMGLHRSILGFNCVFVFCRTNSMHLLCIRILPYEFYASTVHPYFAVRILPPQL